MSYSLTRFLIELRTAIRYGNVSLGIGIPRGTGYIQNYLDGHGMNSLEKDLAEVYQPIIDKSPLKLFLARQWNKRSPQKEKALSELQGVQGLVFSSFRHDNPGAIERDDWTA